MPLKYGARSGKVERDRERHRERQREAQRERETERESERGGVGRGGREK